MAFSFVPLVCTIEDIWASDLSLLLGAHVPSNQLQQLEWVLKEENDLIWMRCVILQIICWSRYANHY